MVFNLKSYQYFSRLKTVCPPRSLELVSIGSDLGCPSKIHSSMFCLFVIGRKDYILEPFLYLFLFSMVLFFFFFSNSTLDKIVNQFCKSDMHVLYLMPFWSTFLISYY